jgi:hypothetical protein
MNDQTEKENVDEGLNNKTPRSVSERKCKANRENAKKSTGPKTPRGKRNSSFNAIKHGLLVKRVAAVIPDSDADQINKLATSLYERYGTEADVHNEIPLELLFVDYWRHMRGLEMECKHVLPAHPDIASIHLRYITANRRALMKTLGLLENTRRERLDLQAETISPAADASLAERRSVPADEVPPKKQPKSYSLADPVKRSKAEGSGAPVSTGSEVA